MFESLFSGTEYIHGMHYVLLARERDQKDWAGKPFMLPEVPEDWAVSSHGGQESWIRHYEDKSSAVVLLVQDLPDNEDKKQATGVRIQVWSHGWKVDVVIPATKCGPYLAALAADLVLKYAVIPGMKLGDVVGGEDEDEDDKDGAAVKS